MYNKERQQKGWTWNPRDFPQTPGGLSGNTRGPFHETYIFQKKTQEHFPENLSTSNIFQKR